MDTKTSLTPKKAVKKCYNKASLGMLLQLIIALGITLIVNTIYTSILQNQILAETDVKSVEELTLRVSLEMHPAFPIILNAASYLVANIAAFIIGSKLVKKLYKAKITGKNQLPVADNVLCIFAILGMQAISLIIQSVIMKITGLSGISDQLAGLASFTGNTLQNVVTVVYFVFIAAITEELLCRGMVMKLLSPVSKTFALFASALIFGIMHGNFNQMFNGFLLGLVIGYAALKSKSIWLPILCHIVVNANALFVSILGEKNETVFLIYIAVLIVAGIISAILLLRRNGRINNSEDGFPCTETAIELTEDTKGLTWKALLTTPCFWIFTAIYVVLAITMLTPVA